MGMKMERKFRTELPRLFELHDLAEKEGVVTHYLYKLAEKLEECALRLRYFREIEEDLSSLDTTSWLLVKKEMLLLMREPHPNRIWEKVHDTLNEVKGFRFLLKSQYKPEFVLRSKINGVRTPDLMGVRENEKVWCEVKTVNVSDVEIERMKDKAVMTVEAALSQSFFKKVEDTLKYAKTQLLAVGEEVDRRLVFLVLNYDDRLHEYEENYFRQLQTFISQLQLDSIEIEIFRKKAFYNAKSRPD